MQYFKCKHIHQCCVDKHSECNKHGNSIILINVQKLHILVQGND